MPDGRATIPLDRGRLFEVFVRNQLLLRGKSHKEFCAEYGITPANFSNFLTGSTHKRCKSFLALAEFLEITEEQLEEIRDFGDLEIFSPDHMLSSVMRTDETSEEEKETQLRKAFARIAELESMVKELSDNAIELETSTGSKVSLKNSASKEKTDMFFEAFGLK